MPGFIFIVMILFVVVAAVWFFSDYDSGLGPIALSVGAILIGSVLLISDFSQTEERTIIVEDKDRGGDDGSYRVYTDGDTLAVKDIWFSFSNRRMDSADLFGDLQKCHRYRVTVRGWEFGPMSLMPNIDRVLEDLGEVEDCEDREE